MSRRQRHGHHGGAWKVAYADFVTAMMALFIVLWILAGNDKTQAAVAAYFRHPRITRDTETGYLSETGAVELRDALERIARAEADAATPSEAEEPQGGDAVEPPDSEADGLLGESARELERLLHSSKALAGVKAQVTIEFTSQGMRIQIQDPSNQPLFTAGSAAPNENTRDLLFGIARIIAPLPNAIMVEGHTDSRPFAGRTDYTNWELSADRANAARRMLEAGGVDPSRIARVVGHADRRPLDGADPADERNRRIAIIVCHDAAGAE